MTHLDPSNAVNIPYNLKLMAFGTVLFSKLNLQTFSLNCPTSKRLLLLATCSLLIAVCISAFWLDIRLYTLPHDVTTFHESPAYYHNLHLLCSQTFSHKPSLQTDTECDARRSGMSHPCSNPSAQHPMLQTHCSNCSMSTPQLLWLLEIEKTGNIIGGCTMYM